MKIHKLVKLSLIIICVLLIQSCKNKSNHQEKKDYPITPVPFTDVQLHDNFWLPRILTNTEVTIPIAFSQSEETGRIKNFEVAGGLTEGSFCSIYPFDDSDVFKIMEGAAYSLMIKPDPVLESYLDSLIHKISLAQEPDGYLYTNRTILGDSAHEWAGAERWQFTHEHSHELYNVGHMYEAAVAHFQATGKETFLNIAIKNADLVDRDFGWGKIERYPGHQEIEIGLVKLYRVTGNQRYLDLAKFFLDVRGPDGWEYNQAHEKVSDQREPVGHAVRALYMYAGMADIAALTGDHSYLGALTDIWEKIVSKKMYVTGGIGQTGGNEGFGPDYDLPNMSAYCETCASIANVFWNHRMFLITAESKYIDVLERTLYNALLSGVNLNGDLFFYPNPLESNGQHERKAWFGCACCPSNMSRFLPSLPGYIYALKNKDLYINLYASSKVNVQTPEGNSQVTMTTDYPWSGNIMLQFISNDPLSMQIHLRIPGWSENRPVPGDLYSYSDSIDFSPEILVNGKKVSYQTKNGYAVIDREWHHDILEIELPMPVRKVLAHDSVMSDQGRFAIQRGPLVYCLEHIDQEENPDVRFAMADMSQHFEVSESGSLLPELTTIKFKGNKVSRSLEGIITSTDATIYYTAIPYAFWANRGPGQMLIWIPYELQSATPHPAPTLAYNSQITAPGAFGNPTLLADQYKPLHANDHNIGYVHWWPLKDTSVWLTYEFEDPEYSSGIHE